MARTPTDRLNEFVELAFGGRAAALAAALGWQRGAVHKYISGARAPGKSFLLDIEQLGGSAAYIREGRGEIYANNPAGEALRKRVESAASTPHTSEQREGYTAGSDKGKPAQRLPLTRVLRDGAATREGNITLHDLLAANVRAPAILLFDSQVVVVDQDRPPHPGDLVVAHVGERTLLRRYQIRRKTVLLAPLVDGEEEIPLGPTTPYTLVGVVRALCTLAEQTYD